MDGVAAFFGQTDLFGTLQNCLAMMAENLRLPSYTMNEATGASDDLLRRAAQALDLTEL